MQQKLIPYLSTFIIYALTFTETHTSYTFEGSCFCQRVQAIPQICSIYYETREYFSETDVYRIAELCFNIAPTTDSKNIAIINDLLLKTTIKNNYTTPIDSFNIHRLQRQTVTWIGDCQCYRLPISNPAACRLYVELKLINADTMKNCISIYT